jgi:hypothetical protein
MRGYWRRVAGQRRSCLNSFCFEILEDRLALSHAPLALAPEAPERLDIAPVVAEPYVTDVANNPAVALTNLAPQRPAALTAGTGPDDDGGVIGEHILAVAANHLAVVSINLTPGRPALALPSSSDNVARGTEVLSAPNFNPLPIVAPLAGVEGGATPPIEGADRSLIAFSAGELFEGVRAEDSGPLDSIPEFALPLPRFRTYPVEAWALGSFGLLRQESNAVVDTEPSATTGKAPIVATGISSDAVIGTSALSDTVSPRQAYASAGWTVLASSTAAANHVVIVPAALSRFAAGHVVKPETLDSLPACGDCGNSQVANARALSVEIVVSAALTSAKILLSDWYGAQIGTGPTGVLDAALLSTVGLNGAALEGTLHDVMREMKDLGASLVPWIEDFGSSPGTVAAVAFAVAGAGELLARRYRDRRPGGIPIADSSSWLFAQLQNPSDS